MPSITDKLRIEARNERTIRLWPEGSFYKAYERSAYLFVTHLRAYEVKCRYIEAAGQDVVSIGFPQTSLGKLGVTSTEGELGSVTVKLDVSISEQEFLLWREAQSHPVAEPIESTAETTVAARIRSLNLASMTPMQSMMLLSELQAILQEDRHGT